MKHSKKENCPYFFPICEANYHNVKMSLLERPNSELFPDTFGTLHLSNTTRTQATQAQVRQNRHKVPDISYLQLAKFETKILVMVHLLFLFYVVGRFIYPSGIVGKERSRQTQLWNFRQPSVPGECLSLGTNCAGQANVFRHTVQGRHSLIYSTYTVGYLILYTKLNASNEDRIVPGYTAQNLSQRASPSPQSMGRLENHKNNFLITEEKFLFFYNITVYAPRWTPG